MDNIFSKIRGEIDDFMYNSVEVVPGYLFNQYDTIKRCHLYINSRFQDNTWYQNREKIFFNVVKYRRDIAARFLNIDTKDIRLWEMNPKSKWSTFLLEKELKLWLKKNKFGTVLNDAALEAATFGSVVFRKTKKSCRIVDLRRFFLDPTVNDIKDSRFIIVKHLLTTSELRAKVKDGWDADIIDGIITSRDNNQISNAGTSYETNGQVNIINSSPYFEVYERFGEVPEYFLTEKQKDMNLVRSLFIVYEPFSVSQMQKGQQNPNNNMMMSENGKVLFKSKWIDAYPFKDYHYAKTMGRWLGIGVVEDLFNVQERRNEIANQKRVSMEISSIHIFQTQGKTVVNNLLSDLKSGDLIQAGQDGEITPVVNEERNLSAFASEEQDYDALGDKISFANSQAAGEALQSSTPATNAVIAQNNTTSLFGFKRQNLALALTDLFNDFILPQCLKDLSDDHILRFTGTPEELQKLDQGYIDVLTRNWVIDQVLSKGVVPTQDIVDLHKQDISLSFKKQGGVRFVNVKEAFYDDIKFEFDIMIDDEQENVATIASNMFQILTAVGQNPQLLENPVTKALLFEYAEKIGVNPLKLEAADTAAQVQAKNQQPVNRVSESLSYKDAPEDIKRQIEQQAGLQPSQLAPPVASQVQPGVVAPVGSGALNQAKLQ